MTAITANTAKVMSKGQITLPVDIRKALGLDAGDTVTLLSQGDKVIMMNSATYAMEVFQDAVAGEGEQAGLRSDNEVVDLIAEMRSGDSV
jgi:AbrB family looped-hinge helix DNA binding protein